MMSKFFIEHPVLANVLAIVLVLIGAICLFKLPVAQYPNIVPPTVQVTTRYPGASAQTVLDIFYVCAVVLARQPRTINARVESRVGGIEDWL
jgi:Cu/Ag efflux pump CusA